jgi:hypothetical protein
VVSPPNGGAVMPTVPTLNPEEVANPQNQLGDMTPGPSQIMMAAATMHGMGRLLNSGKGMHSDAVGARLPHRAKGFSQRQTK